MTLAMIFVAWLVFGAIVSWWQGRLSIWGWLLQVGLVLDQALNVFGIPFNSGSWADETMSSRIYRMHRDGQLAGKILMPPVDWVFGLWQGPHHCYRAWLKERDHLQNAPEFRERA